MEGRKTYLKPKSYILNTIYDIIELKNGNLMLSDTVHGKVLYNVSMYGCEWELLYTIIEIDKNKSNVTLSVCGERRDKAKEIRREFALLDSMTEGGADVNITGE